MITRNEAIELFKQDLEWAKQNRYPYIDEYKQEAIQMAIEALKQEPTTGKWLLKIEDWNRWTCSECGFKERTDIHVSLGWDYCPKCGVKMVGVEDEVNKNGK